MESNNKFKDIVDKIVGDLGEDEKQHLQFLLLKLLACYGKDSALSAVVIFGDGEGGEIAIASANATHMLATELIAIAHEHVQKQTMSGAPPKEMFN